EVEVSHWMSDKQFADAYAIAQLSRGPNVLIVTLIGYAVAGIPRALAATLAMCPADGPACLLCQPAPEPSQPIALAQPDSGCTGSALDRIDGGERSDPGPVDRSYRYCFTNNRGGCDRCNPLARQSAVAAARRRPGGFCWLGVMK